MTSVTFHDSERPITGRCPECGWFWPVRHVKDAEIAGTLPAHDYDRAPCSGGGHYPTETRRG